jgi:hypothetical protein
MVSQRNQRFDRPPFDLVTPFSQSSRDGWYDAVRRQYATRPPRPSLIHGVPEVDPRALNGRPGTPGLLTPDGLGPSENHTFLPCQGAGRQSVPGSQSESLRRHPARTSGGFGNSGTSEKGDKPSGAPTTPARSVRSSSQSISSSATPPARRAARAPGAPSCLGTIGAPLGGAAPSKSQLARLADPRPLGVPRSRSEGK